MCQSGAFAIREKRAHRGGMAVGQFAKYGMGEFLLTTLWGELKL